jgi:hypothetical protein
MALSAVPAPVETATLTDIEAAQRLAEFHREVAAELPATSRMRGVALRCATHWSRLAGSRRRALAGAETRDGWGL